MKKCKNVECENSFEGKKVYCSFKCRNVFVNKYLRDYSKNSEGLSDEATYLENPKKCLKCDVALDYEQRRGKYCSHSCAASKNNKLKKGLKYKLSPIGRESLIKSANINLNGALKNDTLKLIYEQAKKKCKNCTNFLVFKNRFRSFCSSDCRKEFNRRDMSDFAKYKSNCLFKFNLADFPNEFDFSLIEMHGWYKPVNRGNNLDGVSRDHMYSIRDGFDNNVDPKLIAHPANCRLVLQKQNSSKHKKSSITLEELKQRVNNWNKKFNCSLN